jgi:SpoVK/Ycf46/Vps4 family AAA+-type ATPase
MNTDEFVSEMENLIRARYAAICVTTFEEERCLSIIRKIAQKLNKRVIVWTSTKGLSLDGKALDVKSMDFKTATNMSSELGQVPSLFVWCDAHTHLKNQPVNVRSFKELCQNLRKGCPSNSLLISPVMDIPTELQKDVTVLDLPLPDRGEARRIVNAFVGGYAGHSELNIDNTSDTIEILSTAAVGLAQAEIENSLAKSLVKRRALSKDEVDLVLEEKKQIIRKAGILEYISTEKFDMSKVGGLHNLKSWLEKRKGAFTQAARDFGVEYPRGVLLVGIPGCGKSLSAKCVASTWKMPLLKLDMGRIFSGVVGSSEANMRIALNLCETVAPAILWIDEIEKGLSGSDSGSSDGGVSTRVFGNLLTWMQEKINPVFIFATANNILRLPPELLRKGRFDEIFFVDLPSEEERGEIFSIMIKNCNRNTDSFDIARLVGASGENELGEGVRLTGSEIEAVVRDAMLEAFCRKSVNSNEGDVNTNDIVNEISKIVPLSKSRSGDIQSLREWASENAVRASLPQALDSMRSDEAASSRIIEVSVGRNIDF